MKRVISFDVSISGFDQEAGRAIRDARSALEKAQNDLIRKFMQSDRYLAACDLAGGKGGPFVRVDNDRIAVSLYAEENISGPTDTYEPPLHVDPKLVNSLLNGKLLSTDEKRTLVRRLVPGLISKATE